MNPLRELPAVVILAGGRGQRLGGVLKAGLEYQGRPLLAFLLSAVWAELATAEGDGPETVVVGDRAVLEPLLSGVAQAASLTWAREEPAFSGPVAGLAAAVVGLTNEWTLVLACDIPGVRSGLQALAKAQFGADGAVLVDAEGFAQPLLACYRTAALREAVTAVATQSSSSGKGASLRKVIARLNLAEVLAPASAVADIDEWADAQAWGVTKGSA